MFVRASPRRFLVRVRLPPSRSSTLPADRAAFDRASPRRFLCASSPATEWIIDTSSRSRGVSGGESIDDAVRTSGDGFSAANSTTQMEEIMKTLLVSCALVAMMGSAALAGNFNGNVNGNGNVGNGNGNFNGNLNYGSYNGNVNGNL